MKRIYLFLSVALIQLQACSTKGNDTTQKFVIGQDYQGGVIFYINSTGQHGLIASYKYFTAKWGCNDRTVNGASGVEFGTGNQNIKDIVNSCSETGTAAALCENLTTDGYSDRYLPSRDELSHLHLQKMKLTNLFLPAENFWSSSQYGSNSAWYQHFGGNPGLVSPSVTVKDMVYRICPIRSF